MKRFHISIVFALFITFNACQTEQVNHDLVIRNVTVIDVETGQLLPNRHVAIDNDRITAVYEKDIQVSEATQVIDGSEKFLIPGLWDMHTHYNWNYTNSNPLLLANGVTGIREMWGDMSVINMIREESRKGNMNAPDIYSAGSIIDGTPPIWPTSSGVANAEEAIAEVDKQIAEGVDFLKVYSRLTKEAYEAIAKKSKEAGIPFGGHVPMSLSLWDIMEAGQQSSEHMYGILEASSKIPEELAAQQNPFSLKSMELMVEGFDEKRFDSLATVWAASDMWMSPTLTVLRSIANLDDTTFTNDKRVEYLPSFITASWNPANDFRFRGRPAEFYEVSRKKYEFQLSLVGKLSKKGVKIIAGTDYPNPYCYPGFSLHDELELLVKGGMDNLSALQAATLNPAIFQQKTAQFGTIEKNKVASLVLLNANPLEQITNTRKIAGVLLRGKYFDRKALDEQLEMARTLAGN